MQNLVKANRAAVSATLRWAPNVGKASDGESVGFLTAENEKGNVTVSYVNANASPDIRKGMLAKYREVLSARGLRVGTVGQILVVTGITKAAQERNAEIIAAASAAVAA